MSNFSKPPFSKIMQDIEASTPEQCAAIMDAIAKSANEGLITGLSMMLMQSQKTDDALMLLDKSLVFGKNKAALLNQIAHIYLQQKQVNKAQQALKQALKIDPAHATSLNNLGNLYKSQGKYTQAIECYLQAVDRAPDQGIYFNNLADAFLKTGQVNEARLSYEQAVTLIKDNAALFYNFANLEQTTKRRPQAVELYRKALSCNPNFMKAKVALMHQLRHLGQWKDVEKLEAEVKDHTTKALAQNKPVLLDPFMAITFWDDPKINLAIAQAASQKIVNGVSGREFPIVKPKDRQHKKKITLGYLSCDYHDHATAHLIHNLFAQHKRSNFQVLAFSYGADDGSDYRQKLKEDCDQFIDISSLSHMEAAKSILDHGVDILIDLKGHTKGNRLQICAYRPAPIQVTYLGFPGTSGAPFFDYMITDKVVSPPEDAAYYFEKLVYMPDTYQVTDDQQKISDQAVSRADYGLPEDGFVFCCLNNNYKIEAGIFKIWRRLLSKCPNSVLWLLEGSAEFKNAMEVEARAYGINPSRLIWAQPEPKGKHLARLKLADLALDTRICGGHTTTTDALWAGLPVLTMTGKHFASRVATSLLRACGMDDLVVVDEKAYEEVAEFYAAHPQELKMLKDRLSENKQKEPLFKTADFVAHLEDAYQIMWDHWQQGEEPKAIDLQTQNQ